MILKFNMYCDLIVLSAGRTEQTWVIVMFWTNHFSLFFVEKKKLMWVWIKLSQKLWHFSIMMLNQARLWGDPKFRLLNFSLKVMSRVRWTGQRPTVDNLLPKLMDRYFAKSRILEDNENTSLLYPTIDGLQYQFRHS